MFIKGFYCSKYSDKCLNSGLVQEAFSIHHHSLLHVLLNMCVTSYLCDYVFYVICILKLQSQQILNWVVCLIILSCAELHCYNTLPSGKNIPCIFVCAVCLSCSETEEVIMCAGDLPLLSSPMLDMLEILKCPAWRDLVQMSHFYSFHTGNPVLWRSNAFAGVQTFGSFLMILTSENKLIHKPIY